MFTDHAEPAMATPPPAGVMTVSNIRVHQQDDSDAETALVEMALMTAATRSELAEMAPIRPSWTQVVLRYFYGGGGLFFLLVVLILLGVI